MKTISALIPGLSLQPQLFSAAQRQGIPDGLERALPLHKAGPVRKNCAMTSPPQQMHTQMRVRNWTAMKGLIYEELSVWTVRCVPCHSFDLWKRLRKMPQASLWNPETNLKTIGTQRWCSLWAGFIAKQSLSKCIKDCQGFQVASSQESFSLRDF